MPIHRGKSTPVPAARKEMALSVLQEMLARMPGSTDERRDRGKSVDKLIAFIVEDTERRPCPRRRLRHFNDA